MKQATILTLLMAMVHLGYGKNASYQYPRTDSSNIAGIPTLADMLKEIKAATGLQGKFELKEANVLNIEASVSHRKRYILYNPDFIGRINSLTRNKWAVMALLAHEIGHHLNGHTIRRGGSNHNVELEADEFAGFVLQKMGATLQQSQLVMHYIARPEGSKTHPSKNARLLAIEKGWFKSASVPKFDVAARP